MYTVESYDNQKNTFSYNEVQSVSELGFTKVETLHIENQVNMFDTIEFNHNGLSWKVSKVIQ